MNIEFKAEEPVNIVKKRAIYVCGEKVGEVEESVNYFGDTRFHVVFGGFPGSSSLVQGHGDTERDAVIDAISGDRQRSMDRLQALEDLQFRLFGPLEMVSNA